jgi:O-6-methylguanine DNA methyltransferase
MPVSRQLFQLSIATPDGQFVARYSDKGLAELDFPVNGRAELPLSPDAQQRVPTQEHGIPAQIREWHRTTESALKNILAGRAPENLPSLDAAGTAFQKSVWREMRKIPLGRTKSYGEVAQAIGNPKAVRAVGGACSANPIPILVPCHRVLAAHGKIGGFGGGLDWKRKLLAREGVAL